MTDTQELKPCSEALNAWLIRAIKSDIPARRIVANAIKNDALLLAYMPSIVNECRTIPPEVHALVDALEHIKIECSGSRNIGDTGPLYRLLEEAHHTAEHALLTYNGRGNNEQ